MTTEFEVKDLCPLRYFLGTEVVRSTRDFLVPKKICS